VRVMTVIVVGVDGSEESKAALRWAHAEATLRHASLRAIHAEAHDAGGPERVAWLDGVVCEVLGESPGVEVVQSIVEGDAAHVLVEAVGQADLLVVGSRGHGGFAGLLLGSVSQACAQHASCPVVIVCESGARPACGEGSGTRGIVVGVDGSRQSKIALRFALEEARLRESSIHVVHAWKHSTGGLYTYYTGGLGGQLGGPPRTRAEQEQEWLSRFVRCTAFAGDVPVVESVVEGDPAAVLLEASKEADLLVLGSRGWGGVTGLLLGSVSQPCAQHAGCPVVIVRATRRIRQAA
jgi:nucleotide-binding universal stress UspA family protein